MPRPAECICLMGPGHEYPNQEYYMLDHRCAVHGEKTLPKVWGRHKDLQLKVDRAIYDILHRQQEEANAQAKK